MPTSAQQVFDQRVSTVQVPTEGQLGEEQIAEEVVTDARDRMRADMRFSHTSAAITPQVFTDVLQHREQAAYERISTVRVEETGQEITASASTTDLGAEGVRPGLPAGQIDNGALHDGHFGVVVDRGSDDGRILCTLLREWCAARPKPPG